MTTQDVEKVVLILKLLQYARNIDEKYNALPAIIANRDMIIEYDVFGDMTFILISYGDYKCQIALSYQDMYYEGFDGIKARSLIQRAINTLVHQAQKSTESDMNCKVCGEQMEGDGYTVVVHCPRVDVSVIEPDCNPVYCETDDEH